MENIKRTFSVEFPLNLPESVLKKISTPIFFFNKKGNLKCKPLKLEFFESMIIDSKKDTVSVSKTIYENLTTLKSPFQLSITAYNQNQEPVEKWVFETKLKKISFGKFKNPKNLISNKKTIVLKLKTLKASFHSSLNCSEV